MSTLSPSTVRPSMLQRSILGFTAIELMITVAVVAIFSALAAPSFRELIATQRIKSVAAALSESLWVARSEALKRNANVAFVFPNSGSNTAVSDWKITQSSDGSGDALLQQSGSPSVVSTTSSGGNLLFVFNSSGRLASGGSSSIQLSVPSANVNRWVCVSAGGRAITQTTSCS
ncbi:GspH/FimT family pseudopilin [Rhizobacter sp. Root404]|uniref:GspH/FimT family pseudopilin n=1 Tax=Rhizobacter sp. Root404 TaxID=1736528 RepID=UPI0009E9475B|nr:GspH/FimT family pseudopilin [Rhizobacter sp. Root404]